MYGCRQGRFCSQQCILVARLLRQVSTGNLIINELNSSSSDFTGCGSLTIVLKLYAVCGVCTSPSMSACSQTLTH